MPKTYLTFLLLFISSSLSAEYLDEIEIEGKISRVGGNGSNAIFFRSEHGKFQISVPNVEIYNTCEKYLLMKMEKGYNKVRLINVDAEITEGPIKVKFTLNNESYCMLEGPPASSAPGSLEN